MKYIYMANLATSNKEGFWTDKLLSGEVASLETFWKGKDVAKLLDSNSKLNIFMDSGAHSLLNAMTGLINSNSTVNSEKVEGIRTFSEEEFRERLDSNAQIFFAEKQRSMVQGMADFSLADNTEVRKYLDEYIAFVHKYKDQLHAYVNLDIIYNAEKSWENQKYMESNGLKPLPVFHFLEDFKWLKKYAEEYEYIGLGGMATGLRKADFLTFAYQCFQIIAEVNPQLKVHGFAVTSVDMIQRFPFYSVDSTSWLKSAAFGNVVVPKCNIKGEFDFTLPPLAVVVSEEAKIRPNVTNPHYTTAYTEEEKEKIESYLKGLDIDLLALETSHHERQKVNVMYFSQLLAKGIAPSIEEFRAIKTLF